MRLSGLVLALSCAGGVSSLNPRQDDTNNSSTKAAAIPRSFIVEYISGQASKRDSIASNANIAVVKTFDSDVFSGATIETDKYNLDSLSALPNVARVWPNERVYLGPVLPKTTADVPSTEKYFAHNATGVNKLHEQGVFGKGAKVGVVDTGTWYKHPALGGGFGEGYKVAGGYDFVGNGYWPANNESKKPDDDPIDQLGHGTHVAGIVAGKTDGWTGVAPEATLYIYKVFAQLDASDTATLIEAFLTAYEDGVDVITASIGQPGGWSTHAWAVVASRLVDQGLVVTISAGNSGEEGPLYGSDGSSGENVIAVASAENDMLPTFPFGATFGADNETVLGYLPSTNFFPASVVGWPVVPLSLNASNPAEACEAYPEGYRNLTGVIPLVRRGTCKFEIKQEHLMALGAEYILFYNNEDPMITPATESLDGLIGLVTADVGKAIIDTVKAGDKVTADFSLDPENPVGYASPTGSTPNYYTQWGPSYDLFMKPDVAAPGGNIFSTYLDDSYAVMSGTSMAAPYVAGIAALYIGAHGGRSVHGKGFGKALSQRIISSGSSLPWVDDDAEKAEFAASVAQVGNGLVNGFKVLNYSTAVDYAKFNLNDTAHFQGTHEVVVTNNGDEDVQYTFSAQSAAGIEILGFYESYFGLPYTRTIKRSKDLVPKELSVHVDLPEDFVLGPGDAKTVPVVFKNPSDLGWNETVLPLYSGKVIVSSSVGEQLSIPYLGLGADLKKELSPNYLEVPRAVSTIRQNNIVDKPYFTFNLSLSTQDFPRVYSSVIWGTKQVRWDIFEPGWNESDWTYPPVPGSNGYIGPAAYWVGSGVTASYFDRRYYDPNNTLTYPIIDVGRNRPNTAYEYWWFGKLGNGSQIELGNYTMRFATLRPFGDPKSVDDWDVLESPEIAILDKY